MSNPVQQKTATNGGATTVSVTFTATVTSGNAVYVVMGSTAGSSDVYTSVTDDKSNTYTILQTSFDSSAGILIGTAVCFNITNTPQTITATKTGSASTVTAVIYEVNGALSTDANVQGSHTFSSSAMNATFTTTASNEFAVIGVSSSSTGTFTQNNGWSQDFSALTFFNVFSNTLVTPGANACNATPNSGTTTTWVILSGGTSVQQTATVAWII